MMAYAPMNDAFLDSLYADLTKVVSGALRRYEPMDQHTSWKVGGAADFWFEPADEADFVAGVTFLDEREVDWMILGKGSNTLFSDAGYSGVVINLENGLTDVGHEENGFREGEHLLRADAGVSINALLRYVIVNRLEGLEMLTGIPGTVGGTVRMNGGTHLGELKDALHDVRLYQKDVGVQWVPGETLALRYRDSDIQKGDVVLAARFRVRTAKSDEFATVIRDVKERRRETQPLTSPSGGSTFANPEGNKAWRLIDAAGLRGVRIGGACFSEIHSNFIVNEGDASASDIESLIQLAKREVQKKFGIVLREEVCRVGVFAENHTEEKG
jgi:UDP-N-acetylmuramate dehydrogenase